MQYSKALAAMCLQRSKTPRTERSLISADLLEEQPQDIVDEVLEYLDTFDNGKSPYAEEHPWVLNLGGYVMDTERSSRNVSARQSARKSARDSARSGGGAVHEMTDIESGKTLLDATVHAHELAHGHGGSSDEGWGASVQSPP